jgi:restriction endonuclease S subunit
LEGLEAAEIEFKIFNNDKILRLESEYWNNKSNIKIPKFKGNEIIDFVQYGTSEELNENKVGYPVLRLNEFDSFFIGVPEKYCSGISEEEFKNYQLLKGDVLICRTNGNPHLVGRASIVPEDTNFAYASYLFKIRTDENKILPETLVAYLRGRHGRQQINAYSMVGNQTNFSPAKFKEIDIPRFSSELNKKIKNLFDSSFFALTKSKTQYDVAHNLLLSSLGLKNWEPSIKNNNEKSFKESFLEIGRLDAEYYQPKYDELELTIRSHNFKKIKDIRSDNYRGLQPIYVPDGDLDVINSKHILEKTLDYDNFEKSSSKYWDEQERARVFKGDILTYTTGANIGRTQIYLIDKKAIASNHVNILRLHSENPYYIGFVMNSIIGRLQTEKFSAGSAQAELYPKDIDEFLIPLVDKETQDKIVQLNEESFLLQQKSKQLLESAKKAVEIAIEKNEKEALKFINESF